MELIANETLLNVHSNRLICPFKHVCVVVVQATDQCSMYDMLRQSESKTERMTVGLNFTRTTPRLIDRFKSNEDIHFLKLRSHTFRPKSYFFHNNSSDWGLIVGSPSFIGEGFGLSMEAYALISGEDKQNDFYKQYTDCVNNVQEQSARLISDGFEEYKTKFKRQKKEHPYDRYKFPLAKYGAIIDSLSWGEYIRRVMEDKDDVEARCQILKKTYEFFNEYSPFKDFPGSERKCAAGTRCELPGMEDVDQGFFDTYFGNDIFTKAIVDNNTKLVKIIGAIPLEGKVTAKQYKKHCSMWEKEFKGPVALASCLSAVRCPDLFVCIDNRNGRLLCDELAIPQSSLSMDSY